MLYHSGHLRPHDNLCIPTTNKTPVSSDNVLFYVTYLNQAWEHTNNHDSVTCARPGINLYTISRQPPFWGKHLNALATMAAYVQPWLKISLWIEFVNVKLSEENMNTKVSN